MSDPREQPDASGVSATPPDAGFSPAPALGAFPGAPAVQSGQSYRSLSVLALVGFGIGAVYSSIIAVMALVGLFTGRPLLLSLWTATIPLSAILLCLLARSQINNSEGTLAGAALSRWGMLLSLFVCLCYWAYVLAIFLAVRQQARNHAEAWMSNLAAGDLGRAGYDALPPLERLNLNEDDPDLLAKVQNRIMMALEPAPGAMDPFARFTQLHLVRMLLQGGSEARWTSRGVKSWDYVGGGYQVVLLYEVEVPEGSCEALVTVQGRQAQHNEYPDRRWFVDLNATRISDRGMAMNMTELGRRVHPLYERGRHLLDMWKQNLGKIGHEYPFALTLSTVQHEKIRKDLKKAFRLAAVAGPLAATEALPGAGERLAQFTRFQAGQLVQLDPTKFKGSEEVRAARVLEEIRKRVPGAEGVEMPLELSKETPLRTVQGNTLRISYDFQLVVPREFLVSGVFDLETDAAVLRQDVPNPEWRLASIRVQTVRTSQGPQGERPREGPQMP
jgi:hypothetical protein